MKGFFYISSFVPKQDADEFHKNMVTGANISASVFSYSLLSGFSSIVPADGMKVLNIPPRGPYPFLYQKLFSRTHTTNDCNRSVRNIGSFNLYILQNFSIRAKLGRSLRELSDGENVVVVYSIILPVLEAVVRYKRDHPNTKVVLIVPDLYEDISSNCRIKRLIKNFIFGDVNDLISHVDGFVYLTEQMKERVGHDKPYCVVEGIYNPSEKRAEAHTNGGAFTILYTGMLHEKFGVKNLIDAVCSLDKSDLKLQLCGSGDLEPYINEKAAEDPRIEYMGIVPRERVLEMQGKASLLVNPRQPNGGFTRYSFPSKNIEYLASGTPTLIYKLEGIPDEYYQYCYNLSASQTGVEELAAMLNLIYDTPVEARLSLAQKAQQFIFAQKNAPAQCKKILELIRSL